MGWISIHGINLAFVCKLDFNNKMHKNVLNIKKTAITLEIRTSTRVCVILHSSSSTSWVIRDIGEWNLWTFKNFSEEKFLFAIYNHHDFIFGLLIMDHMHYEFPFSRRLTINAGDSEERHTLLIPYQAPILKSLPFY